MALAVVAAQVQQVLLEHQQLMALVVMEVATQLLVLL
jgi:hypothetical protein